MSTTASPGSSERGPSPEDVRRQLEGGVETVEAAHGRYSSLQSLLSGVRWKHRLREQPEAIRAVLRHESSLDEALARIQRRAQVDQWPEELPILTVVREVRALRGRLEALVHKRLGGGPAHTSGAPSLVEALTRLEALVFQPFSLELGPGEVCLLEGRTLNLGLSRRIHVMLILSMLASGLFAGGSRSLALLVPFAAYLLYARSCRDRYWLTNERLVWMPEEGKPIQLPLRSIREDGIHFPFSGGMRVEGEHESITLNMDEKERRTLLLALEMRRKLPLLGSATTELLTDVVCYPATLQSDSSRKGFVVLRPGYVAFLPVDQAGVVLRTLTDAGSTPLPFNSPPFDVPSIVEQLRYLPSGAAFDAYVKRAVAAVAGEFWSVEDVLRYGAHIPPGKQLQFKTIARPQKSLSGKVDPSQQAAAERILADWPKR